VATYHIDRVLVLRLAVAHKPKVVTFRYTAEAAERRIRESAMDSANVSVTTHALERMEERGLSTRDLYTILRTGYVDDIPKQDHDNQWTCKITLKMPGGRTAGVVTVILVDGKLLIVTVEWEDGL